MAMDKTIKITDKVKDFLESNSVRKESFDDTLRRLLKIK